MLADYDPLSERELGLRQMDEVELLRTGCSGWWFVQLVRPPYSQVLQKLHLRNFLMNFFLIKGLGPKYIPPTS